MLICAVYICWADCLDLLYKSVANISPVVDQVIIVASKHSNHGNFIDYELDFQDPKVKVYWHEPVLNHRAAESECEKRNYGLQKAREAGMTHFIGLDGDEFYDQKEFAAECGWIQSKGIEGTVCGLRVYLTPTLWCEDHTLVPFIHKITPYLRYKLDSRRYPFAYDEKGIPRIDPTRRMNLTSGVEWSKIIMHHFSYVRKNMDLKIDNSSANLRRSREVIYRDVFNAKEGHVSELYHRTLKKTENRFNL